MAGPGRHKKNGISGSNSIVYDRRSTDNVIKTMIDS